MFIAGKSPCGIAGIEAIEVLLRHEAYVVKRGGDGPGADRVRLGQISWSKYGGPHVAWDEAKLNANWKP